MTTCLKNPALLLLFFSLLFFSCQTAEYDFSKRPPTTEEGLKPFWLTEQIAVQKEASATYSAFHNFKFEDKRGASGITFKHHITDDSGKNYRPNHYDHGSGIAIADVDGDNLLDIYFVSQIGRNELWRNIGNGQFEDITDKAGLRLSEVGTGVTASFADIDNDGDPDLYATFVKTGNLLFENDGIGNFTNISSTSGIDYHGHASGATFFDYDKDGLLDLFLSNVGVYTTDNLDTMQVDGRDYYYYTGVEDGFAGHLKPERTEQSLLFKNQGGNHFLAVSQTTGLIDTSWSGDAFPLDVNQDGWLDLYVLNMQGHDEYYENVQGQRFEKKSRDIFPKTSWGAMSAKHFDFDNDGHFDIFITDMHSDMTLRIGPEAERLKSDMQWTESFLKSEGKSIFGNSFFKRTAAGTYEEVSDQIQAETYWPWGLSTGDLNADGFDDVFIASSMNYPYRYTSNIVLLNEGGKRFLPSEFILGVEPRRDSAYAQTWFKIDCSGDYADHRDCKGRKGEVSVWSPLGSRSSAIFDLDNDGDLDIVTNEFNSGPLVLISNLSTEKQDLRYLKIKLTGSASNRDGLGTMVKVTADGKSYYKIMDGKSGYLSQSVHPLYFGLDNAEEIEKIEIYWPSGQTQLVEEAAFNTLLEITEPELSTN